MTGRSVTFAVADTQGRDTPTDTADAEAVDALFEAAVESYGRVDAVARMDAHQNRWFLDPVLRGTYPIEMLEHYQRQLG